MPQRHTVQRNSVLVGVDGSESGPAAIRYGAQEALRLGANLEVVHLVPNYVPITAMREMLPADLEAAGLGIQREATAEAHLLLEPERVTVSLHHGPRVATLVDLADGARLIVLGVRRRPAAERLLTGTTLHGVASRATTPVVVVPSDWAPGRAHQRVVAGVKSTERSDGLVRRALETAAGRDAELVLLHAWELPNVYDDLVAARVDQDEWRRRAEDTIQHSLEEQRRVFPTVRVEVRVVHGQPAKVLQVASETADLLVLARRPSGVPLGHLGGTGRTLLRESRCPVEVVPPGDPRPQLG